MSNLATQHGIVYFFKEWCVVEIGCMKRIVGWNVDEKSISITDPIDYFDNEFRPSEAETTCGDRIVLVGECRLTLESTTFVNSFIKKNSIMYSPRFYQIF